MQIGTAFEFAGMSFGPKPEGWDGFVVITSARTLLFLSADSCLGDRQSVVIDLTDREADLLEEGISRHSANKLRAALSEFRPIDALDILRAAHGGRESQA